jgi:hypothetical protein
MAQDTLRLVCWARDCKLDDFRIFDSHRIDVRFRTANCSGDAPTEMRFAEPKRA